VYKTRRRAGRGAGAQDPARAPGARHRRGHPVPDTSRTAGLALAQSLGIKYREGFIKNRYIGRTFIMPGQQQRKKSVRQKLNPIRLEFEGKNVMLVDDSIVRGTTSREIIQMARDAGAASGCTSPPRRRRCATRTSTASTCRRREELIAHGRSVEEISALIGADWLVYQDLDELVRCSAEGNPTVEAFECSVFDGVYVTGDIDEAYLAALDAERNDDAQTPQQRVPAATAWSSASTTKCPKPAEQAGAPVIVFSSAIL
jgi:amidophosphoribosyltransferase